MSREIDAKLTIISHDLGLTMKMEALFWLVYIIQNIPKPVVCDNVSQVGP